MMWRFWRRKPKARTWRPSILSTSEEAFRAFLLGLDVYSTYSSDAHNKAWPIEDELCGLDLRAETRIVGRMFA